MTIEWVGAIPGKRESRRFVGDHILCQQDIIEQRDHYDAVGYGGGQLTFIRLMAFTASTTAAVSSTAKAPTPFPIAAYTAVLWKTYSWPGV